MTPNILKWPCTNKNNKLMRALFFKSIGRAQEKNKWKKEDHIFLSNGRVQVKEIDQWRP